MGKLTRLSTEDRENLAAYLDGELDENSTRRIESVLTSSEVARNEVDVLAQTYDMLDLLPRPRAAGDFTEKTLATAKLTEYRKPLTQHQWFRSARKGAIFAGWGLALLTAGVVGYSLAFRWIPRQDDFLLQQLPLIQKLDVYVETGNIEFVKELSAQKQLLKELQGSPVNDPK
ncbi:anti-sigma factor family protein [Planctomicrobium sp. SH527]|uniref:anti-sigma factor family protein n=1 Tax=Planctomicrobium sp. SH527 TaxID=3448123 RepID=UPI003F5AEC99